MSRYDLDNLIVQATSMDRPSNLPSKPPRWQRAQDSQMYNSFNVSTALNQTNEILTNLTLAEQHVKHGQATENSFAGASHPHKTPRKTPSSKKSSQNSIRGLASATKTPCKTPTHGGNDRYIPNRNAMDLEKCHHILTQANRNGQENDTNLREKLSANLDNYRIFHYTNTAPDAPEGQGYSKVVYSSSKSCASGKKSSRLIPSQPEKVLDAPDLKNDWYLNLVSWSNSNVLAVALSSYVYLWNAKTGDIKCLLQTPDNEYVSSLSWIQDGNHLAVGTSTNMVEIWDADTNSRLRKMAGHCQRVNALDWNSYTLTSGSKSGLIHHHDVRVANHHVGTLNGHDGHEICGLRWSPDGKYLASGANDNRAHIWAGSTISSDSENTSPLKSLAHSAAVKAISWCPWKPNLIATGGGTMDRHVRVWNSLNGNCLHSVDTKSQVSGIEWSEEYQELVSAHGYQNNELSIWKFPTMTKVGELRGHSHRIIGLCMSPDRSTVVSLSADETLRFWECFAVDPQRKKKLEMSAKKTSINPIRMSLR